MKIAISKLEIIIIISAILLSYSFIPDYGSITPKLIVFFILSITLSILLKYGVENYSLNYRSNTSIILMIFLVIIMFYHQRWSDLNFILKLGIAYIMVLIIKIDTVFEVMCKLSKILLIPTVLGYVLGSLGYVINVTDILTDGRELFITPVLTSQKDIVFTRANSYFWEPGVFAFVVNFIIAYKLFRKNENLNSIKVEVVYLIIAQSAGGIISFIMLMIAYYINKYSDKKIEVLVSLLAVFCCSIFFYNLKESIQYLTGFLNFFTLLFLERDLLQDASYSTRIVDFYAPFYAAFESPVFGAKDLSSFRVLSESIRGFSADGITNSWSSIAYKYGYPFMFLYLTLVFVGTKRYFRSALIPFVFIVLLACSPVYLNIMTLYLVAAMVGYKNS